MALIDLHAHVLTPRFEAALRSSGDGHMALPPQPPEQLRAFMDQNGITAAVISMLAGPAVVTPELARTGNLELAELVANEPDRLGALAVLPVTGEDVGAAVAETEHALDTLGLDGVALLSHHGGTYLGDPVLDPLFAELDRRGAYAMVHPTAPPGGWPLPHHPVWLYEFPFETTRAIVNLVYAGTFERYPRIRFQFAHLGGAAPYLAHRIASLTVREPELATRAPAGAMEYIRRQYYDTGLSNSVVALESALALVPLDHVVFGSDWPYLAVPEGRGVTDELDRLPAADRAGIDRDNAAALVPRLAATRASTGRP